MDKQLDFSKVTCFQFISEFAYLVGQKVYEEMGKERTDNDKVDLEPPMEYPSSIDPPYDFGKALILTTSTEKEIV